MTERPMFLEKMLHWKIKASGFKSRFARIRGRRLHYYEKDGLPGSPTLVLIHGISASGGHFHDLFGPLNRYGFKLIVPDLPGHGHSEDLAQAMTAERLLGIFSEFLDAIAPERFALVGNSLGGALSMHYAATHPERVSSLVLASPGLGFSREQDWISLRDFLTVQDATSARALLERLYFRKPFYLGLLSPVVLRNFKRRGVRELLESTCFTDLTPKLDLKAYPGPTLVIWGKGDNFLPRANIDGARSLLPPHAVWEEPHHVGHCPQLDDPRWFSARVAQFVAPLL